MSAPHIACLQGSVQQIYEGANRHPVELCLVMGAQADITIIPPGGAMWTAATVEPSAVATLTNSRETGGALHVTVSARGKGTATLSVAGTWQLRIAVV